MNNSNETKPRLAANDSQPVVIPAAKFRAEVLESEQPVLVEFWTRWSQPCQVFDLVLQELAREQSGKIKVLKVDADENLDLSLSYEIQSVPTLIYFVKGKPRVRIVGTASKKAILEKIQEISSAWCDLRKGD